MPKVLKRISGRSVNSIFEDVNFLILVSEDAWRLYRSFSLRMMNIYL